MSVEKQKLAPNQISSRYSGQFIVGRDLDVY
jgi:hypothetical protein